MTVAIEPHHKAVQLRHSPVEIERKFLVANDAWRQSAVRSVSIRDGLIAVYQDRKVRVPCRCLRRHSSTLE
jgi:CYTH domain-containing protein